ncbi:MAG: hypothetical protein KJ667_09170 [Alphaproteobacteria bacterium]|nr:hypothetical protein [Alphaproteobacteria bacterium]
MKITRFFVTALTCLLMLPSLAVAQPKTTTGLDPSGEPYSNQYYLTMPDRVGLMLLRSSELGPDGFVLRLSMFDAHTTCAKMGPLNTETSYDNMYMDITVASYQVDMRDAPKNPQACDMKTQTPSADIVLNKAELQSRGTTKIRFHYMNYSDVFNIEIGDHFVKLDPVKPKATSRNAANTYKPLSAYQVGSPLELWFLPENTLALYAPAVPQDKNVGADIEALAKGRGLLPITNAVPDFIAPRTTPQAYYFTDPQDMYLKTLKGNKAAVFAPLRLSRTVYGLHGDEVAYQSYDVYMKKPGLYE